MQPHIVLLLNIMKRHAHEDNLSQPQPTSAWSVTAHDLSLHGHRNRRLRVSGVLRSPQLRDRLHLSVEVDALKSD